MKREEILEKSRNENQFTDERQQLVQLNGDRFSIYVLGFSTLALTFLNLLYFDRAVEDMMLIFSITIFSGVSYGFVQTRTKTLLFFSIICLLGLCRTLYSYYLAVI